MKTNTVRLGNVSIGGESPVSIQSMTNLPISQVSKTIQQINRLSDVGCDIIRLAIKDDEAISYLREVVKKSKLSVEADIHFNYRLAIESINAGVDGIRLNPGNISEISHIKEIVRLAKKKDVPIRVGINSGSLPKKFSNYQDKAKAMVLAALGYIEVLKSNKFSQIIVSLKASDVLTTVRANRMFSKKSRYPIHLGITATGLWEVGSVKSAIGIGSLLLDGIGDTIRVSLTADPTKEVIVAKTILSALGIRKFGPEVIACPTCGRCEIDVEKIAEKISSYIAGLGKTALKIPVNTIAVMGCVVNGPGEAKDADIAVCGGKKCAVVYKNGHMLKKVQEKDILNYTIDLINEKIPV